MYRVVHCRMWRRGGSFRNLSGPAVPNAQHLWLFLLTGDATITIPGVLPIDKISLAAKLDWHNDDIFDGCLSEIELAGMAEYDWDAGLVWCPGALTYNKPQSPNVVRYWGKAFDGLPECDLKATIWTAIGEYCSELGDPYLKAFSEGFPEGFVEGFPYSVTVTDTDTVTDTKAKKKKAKPSAKKLKAGFDAFWEEWPRKVGKSTALRAWMKAREERRILEVTEIGKKATKTEMITIPALVDYVRVRAATDPQWTRDGGQFIVYPSTFLNQSRWLDQYEPLKNKNLPGVRVERPQTTEEKRRKLVMKNIARHANALLMNSNLPDSMTKLVHRHAEELMLLSDKDITASKMIDEFYVLCDAFSETVYAELGDGDKAAVDKGRPAKTKVAAWRRKRIREVYHLPDPLDVEPD